MNKEFREDFPLQPTPKERARAAVHKGHIHYYTPNKTAHLENLIKDRCVESGIYFEKD